MTTGMKVKQTLVSLQGAKATLDSYSELVASSAERQAFKASAEKLAAIVQRLEKRVRELEFEEPQYKGF